VVNALNMPSLSAEDAARLRPYIKLVEQLGGFAGQLMESDIQGVEIEYCGHAGELNVKPLTAIALTSLLAPQLDTVNMVNVQMVCRERDIRVSETRCTDTLDFNTLVRVKVTTQKRSRGVAGTLFGGDKPRIISVEDIAMEAELGPHMLFVRNEDKPGFIGNLGRTLGEAGINIATFHLGRSAPGADAVCLIQVDQPLSDAVIDRVRHIPNVVQAKQLHF
jgi:D-3-phosphoglycerate dehydrogenase